MRAAKKIVALASVTGLVMLASTSAALAGVCDQHGYQVRWHGAGGVVMHTANDYYAYACSPAYGLHVRFGEYSDDIDPSAYGIPVIGGQFAGWFEAVGDNAEGDMELSDVFRANLANGKKESRNPVSSSAVSPSVRSFAVAPNGSLAWLVDYSNEAGDRYVRSVHVWDASGEREFARGQIITPKYLAFALGMPNSELVYARTPRNGWSGE